MVGVNSKLGVGDGRATCTLEIAEPIPVASERACVKTASQELWKKEHSKTKGPVP